MATKIKTSTTRNLPSANGAIIGPGTGTGPHPGNNGTSPGGSDTSPKIPKDRTTKTIKEK